jgi:hypothetical protein
MKKRILLLAGFGSVLLWTLTVAAAPAQKEHALKVGKKGEITLTQQTKVGNIVLQPDTYVIQHRESGGNHFVRFVELKQVEAQPANAEQSPYTYTEADKAGEVKCRLESAAGPVKETTAHTVAAGGMVRITKVAIQGEDVLHVF